MTTTAQDGFELALITRPLQLNKDFICAVCKSIYKLTHSLSICFYDHSFFLNRVSKRTTRMLPVWDSPLLWLPQELLSELIS